MRVVADTNVMVSALLWTGIPNQILATAEARRITLCTSPALLEELAGVLSHPRLIRRLAARRVTVESLIAGYARLAHLVSPRTIPPVITADPDDDAVLACALAAQAAYIISGDPDLLDVKRYGSIHVVSPRSFLELLTHH